MYAVFKSGGKQHRVTEGQTLRLEKIDAETGSNIEFDEVLLVADGENVKVGEPTVSGSKIKAEIISHGRADKIKIVKFRRRKHSRKQMGHRQCLKKSQISINRI